MVTLHRGAYWRIAVYGREHGVPHFHIEGRGWRCSIGMNDLEIIIGSAPKIALEEVIAWAAPRKAELLAIWRELNP